tara:strand:- start:328 stop:591 length:264 start_codon:yes stop_codon:yes gene_type:complete
MGTITIVNNFQLFDEFIASLCQDETSQITPANQIFFDGFVETISPSACPFRAFSLPISSILAVAPASVGSVRPVVRNQSWNTKFRWS